MMMFGQPATLSGTESVHSVNWENRETENNHIISLLLNVLMMFGQVNGHPEPYFRGTSPR